MYRLAIDKKENRIAAIILGLRGLLSDCSGCAKNGINHLRIVFLHKHATEPTRLGLIDEEEIESA